MRPVTMMAPGQKRPNSILEPSLRFWGSFYPANPLRFRPSNLFESIGVGKQRLLLVIAALNSRPLAQLLPLFLPLPCLSLLLVLATTPLMRKNFVSCHETCARKIDRSTQVSCPSEHFLWLVARCIQESRHQVLKLKSRLELLSYW